MTKSSAAQHASSNPSIAPWLMTLFCHSYTGHSILFTIMFYFPKKIIILSDLSSYQCQFSPILNSMICQYLSISTLNLVSTIFGSKKNPVTFISKAFKITQKKTDLIEYILLAPSNFQQTFHYPFLSYNNTHLTNPMPHSVASPG